ncbi:MAG: TIGR02597 family protein [Limisphaerales bacterium]
MSSGTTLFAATLLATGTSLLVAPVCFAQSSVSSPVGVHKITINPTGANVFAAPMQKKAAWTGAVASATASTITATGTPGWISSQFGPEDGYRQFLVILTKDASASPGNAGDYWLISANTAGVLTVDASPIAPNVSLAAGDTIEVRPLVSVADIFGLGAATVLNPNTTGAPDPATDDIINRIAGTGFSEDIIYFTDGGASDGYYSLATGVGPVDGSTITFRPDEPLSLNRRGTPVTLASVGNVQTTPLSHFLGFGKTAVGIGFPVDAKVGVSKLLESGWTSNLTGVVDESDTDILRPVDGSSFADDYFHFAGGSAAENGWYSSALGGPDANLPLSPTVGYVAFVLNPSGLIWRQPPPF